MKTGMWKTKNESGTAPWPPCRAACPAHTDCRGYAALVVEGRYEEALALIRERAPLAASLGRICHHPCEEKCRRDSVDEAVSIRSLKRFIADANRDGRLPEPAQVKSNGKKVAIIGGGPAGLTAGSDLAKLGYSVVVFERKAAAGGALLYGVPKYRLPKEVLAWDVAYVASTGVEIRVNQEIDAASAKRLADEYDAVIVATGLPISKKIPIPGADADGVMLALPFLEAAKLGDAPSLDGKVVVIGGGNVAIDVARTARRLGAEKVALYCLEGPALSDLPAFSWEIEEAVEEDVEINPSWGPIEIATEGDGVRGMTFKRCVRVFDDNGRFNPQFDEGRKVNVDADRVIFAIGQGGETAFLSEVVKLDERGLIVFDRLTHQTSNPKVYVTGEVATGPQAAIDAIAHGHGTALAIDASLNGRELKSSPEAEAVNELPAEIAEKIVKVPRAHSEMLAPKKRAGSFDEVEASLPEVIAIREALRCLSCGNGAVADDETCAGCLTCVRVCPYDAPFIDGAAIMKADYCQACGLCATECPAKAIEIGAADLRLISGLLEGKPITVFVCREAEGRTRDDGVGNRQTIEVPCAARLDEAVILKAFETGSEGVMIVACGEGKECRYSALGKLAGRARNVAGLLDEIGWGGWRLRLSVDPASDLLGFEAEIEAGQPLQVVEEK